MDPTATSPTTSHDSADAPRWQPLPSIERRLLGVLVEKSKTTADSYPMTLNALRTAANQKSNRSPQMALDVDQVDATLERLRMLGAVIEVHGDGRVPKYRHQMVLWMGVEKVELAVMAELLLRGAQTVGELRGRAGRMEPIADLAALRPVLAALEAKNLIVYLTPQGRGCIVTHNLYRGEEMEKQRAKYGGPSAADVTVPSGPVPLSAAPSAPQVAAPSDSAPSDAVADHRFHDEIANLTEQLRSQQEEISALRDDAQNQLETLRAEVDDIKRQLGI
jgi:uncharacterized protein YceH (UPF0502 family)